MPQPDAPIGVFDSGVGGLSILQALRATLPHEALLYLADSGHAPYGERGDAFVVERSRRVVAYLRQAHGIKALVVACNTATAAAIAVLRQAHPDLPIVGVEPAIKPALLCSQTKRIAVLATRVTLASHKFNTLLGNLAGQAQFVCQPCDGLADAIEHSVASADVTQVEALCAHYISAAGQFGNQPGAIDTLVLGCTHYPFASVVLQKLVGPGVHLLETGVPVARQTLQLLRDAQLSSPATALPESVQLLTTGQPGLLQAACQRWLQLDARASAIAI